MIGIIIETGLNSSTRLMPHLAATMLQLLWHRAVSSLTTFPTVHGWYRVAGITLTTTASAGVVATATQFVRPLQEFQPPRRPGDYWKPCSALIVPSLLEEVFWRGTLLPQPPIPLHMWWTPWFVLLVHVLSHPVAAHVWWPRGKQVFGDWRFLLLATIVLGGSTASFLITGGSAWAAAVTHAVPVALWRDFFKGEERLAILLLNQPNSNPSNPQQSKLLDNNAD